MGSLSVDEARTFIAIHGTHTPIFVETGTYTGTTLEAMRSSGFFRRLHSIELSEALYERAVEKFHGTDVALYRGDSSKILAELAQKIEDSVFFWLDAHWFNDHHVARVHVPLLAELEAISKRNQADIVVIDDVQCFGVRWDSGPESDWTEIRKETILESLGLDRIADHYVTDYKFVIHRTSSGQP